MSPATSIGQLKVADLVATLAREGLSAGAGAAGAVTLALAAACAAKAVAVSHNHRPGDEVLGHRLEVLERIAQLGLQGADRDVQAFAELVKEHTPGTARNVMSELASNISLIKILATTLNRIEPEIETALAGDLVAARALLDASRIILQRNAVEAQEAAATLAVKS